ncbi:sensor histidine kinase [Paenarthrobacter nitroguajacolicus]|uniref:sensor histidine kinase n=1 Tax=Paenarthrobacter nitroguajacolicus TaxID=211146 RepID=UPI0040542281
MSTPFAVHADRPRDETAGTEERQYWGVPTLRPPGITTPLSDVIAVAVVVLFAFLPYPDAAFRAHGLLLVVALLPAAVMPFRRRWPFAALGVSLLCTVVAALAGVLAPSTLIAAAVTSYSVAARTRRLAAASSVATAALVVFSVNALPLHGDLFDSRALQFVLFILLAGAMGDAARSRREYIEAVTERAERAERGREEEARRRVAEERVRIARDLHDVVAHQISVISLSAGVASSSLAARPERAQEALTTIRSASRTVLADIGTLMALLRTDTAVDLHPQAGLSQLNELVTRFTDAGLRVELQLDPAVGELSPASDHVAYLALQEGLTNAHKHGADAVAWVSVCNSPGAVVLTVVNPLRTEHSESASGGHGLRGLRERATAIGGMVETASAHGEFRLLVSIPATSDSEVPALKGTTA